MKTVALSISFILLFGCQGQSEKTPKAPNKVESVKAQSEALEKKSLKHSPPASAVAKYSAALDSLLGTLAGKNEPKMVDAKARQLFTLSQTIITEFINVKPECAEYLRALLKVEESLLKLTPETIESGYHRDGLLPKNEQPVCHHAKDLMVHPATVVILNMQTPRVDRVLMQKEVIELKGHLHEVQIIVGQEAN